MKILGMGFPELILILSYLIIPAILCVAAYFIVKAAVKRGVLEAFEELKKDGKV